MKNNKYDIKLKKDIKYSLCTCGLSKELPLCDNAHRQYNAKNKVNFKSLKIRSNRNLLPKCGSDYMTLKTRNVLKSKCTEIEMY